MTRTVTAILYLSGTRYFFVESGVLVKVDYLDDKHDCDLVPYTLKRDIVYRRGS